LVAPSGRHTSDYSIKTQFLFSELNILSTMFRLTSQSQRH
jgi:hypothetical protein